MQVFLPYPDFEKSVRCLDNKRLGNQIYRECLTLIRGGWPHHPAAKMWANYKVALAHYAILGTLELAARGKDYFDRPWFEEFQRFASNSLIMPEWIGDDRLHSSHRAALLFKNYPWYSQFGWKEKPAKLNAGKFPYFWPIVATTIL